MKVNEEIILNDIKIILSSAYPEIDITMDTYLEIGENSCLDMSSLEIIEFIIVLEKKYDIIIDIDERYYTVGDAVRGVINYLNEKAEDASEEKN